jgi:serine/threonine-protein kinase
MTARQGRVHTTFAPLDDSFRFVHEPIHSLIQHRYVGRQADIDELTERIQFSYGGSFLITGYRGVGKTSFVNQVSQELARRTPLLDIQLNLARPVQPAELMHLIIRRLYERLVEKGWYESLNPQLQTELALAYQRTSANVVRNLSDKWERGIEFGELKFPRINLFRATISTRRSRGVDLETSFLAYDDKAAERDVIAISLALNRGIYLKCAAWRRYLALVRRRPLEQISMKIVFVFDEMDKLDEYTETGGKSAVDEMLSSLKNLFTTSGICFLFVAGKDLHERWLRDLWRGNSIYESVFSYDKYLPCMWNDVDSLCDGLVLLDKSRRRWGQRVEAGTGCSQQF